MSAVCLDTDKHLLLHPYLHPNVFFLYVAASHRNHSLGMMHAGPATAAARAPPLV